MEYKKKENLRLFFRYLKHKDAFGRFMHCTYNFNSNKTYNLKYFFENIYDLEDLIDCTPFPWCDGDNNHHLCNSSKFWSELSCEWRYFIQKNNN